MYTTGALAKSAASVWHACGLLTCWQVQSDFLQLMS